MGKVTANMIHGDHLQGYWEGIPYDDGVYPLGYDVPYGGASRPVSAIIVPIVYDASGTGANPPPLLRPAFDFIDFHASNPDETNPLPGYIRVFGGSSATQKYRITWIYPGG